MLSMLRGSLKRQGGVILVITLVVLGAMTLAAIALMRSADTGSLIVGNLAFQQSVTHSADLGLEAATEWLEAAKNNNPASLYASNTPLGYSAVGQDPSSGQSWDAFWKSVLTGNAHNPVALAQDAAGNTVAYFIQRLCYGVNAEGNAPTVAGAGCSFPASGSSSGCGQGVGDVCPKTSSQVYYRITVRIDGPRGTLNYVQAIVAL